MLALAQRRISAIASRYWMISIIIACTSALYFGGIRHNLPYMAENEEVVRVGPAVNMAATGDLNPHWFGHPGSTVIYPLAAIYHIVDVVWHAGTLMRPHALVAERFATEMSEFYLIGRMLVALYAVVTILFTYLVGRRVFNEQIGLIAAWLVTLSPLVLFYGQIVRTDSAAACFGMLALYCYCRVYDTPSLSRYTAAGVSTGLAISSRYWMLALGLVWLLITVGWLRVSASKGIRHHILAAAAIGGLATIMTFVLTTPFFFLDLGTAIANLQHEARTEHAGADGLSFAGNLWWYLTIALPIGLSWPVWIVALAGIVWVCLRQYALPFILAAYSFAFLLMLCISALHWDRWVIQLLPILSLFAAAFLGVGSRWISRRLLPAHRPEFLLRAIVALLSIQPLTKAIPAAIQASHPGTQIIAREWMEQHLPANSHIAIETYCPPLQGTTFVVHEYGVLAEGPGLASLRKQGFEYAVVSSYRYERYFEQPQLYPGYVGFYNALFTHSTLVQEFLPSLFDGGPQLRIYKIVR